MAGPAVLAAWLRIPLVAVGVVVLGIGEFWSPAGRPGTLQLVVGVVLFAAGLALYLRLGTVRRPPVRITMPVRGQWIAVHSPADKVPSHGLQPTARRTRSTSYTNRPTGPSTSVLPALRRVV